MEYSVKKDYLNKLCMVRIFHMFIYAGRALRA